MPQIFLDCPRCDEGDLRSVGLNRCGLCGCQFLVASNGAVRIANARLRSHLKKLEDAGGADDAGNVRSSFHAYPVASHAYLLLSLCNLSGLLPQPSVPSFRSWAMGARIGGTDG